MLSQNISKDDINFVVKHLIYIDCYLATESLLDWALKKYLAVL